MSDGANRCVANRVSQRVVDQLQIVNVNHDHAACRVRFNTTLIFTVRILDVRPLDKQIPSATQLGLNNSIELEPHQ